MQFDRFLLRKYKGHPTFSYVDMFYKVPPKAANPPPLQQKQIFTQSFTRDYSIVSSNVLVTSNNPLITKEICKMYRCRPEMQWITVPKHLSEVMMLDMVVLMNTYCDCKTRQQYWDVYYYVPTAIPLSTFRHTLQCAHGSDDDEEDLSMKP